TNTQLEKSKTDPLLKEDPNADSPKLVGLGPCGIPTAVLHSPALTNTATHPANKSKCQTYRKGEFGKLCSSRFETVLADE
ncbi:hypothetical protein AVEN_93669-1, partial [Araneus ventricosus]